jgi:hypothetical protein
MGGEGASFAWPKLGWRAVVAGVLAAVVLGIVIMARLSGDESGPGSSAADQRGRASEASATPSVSPSPTANDGVVGAGASPYGQPPAPAAVRAAVAFVRAWTHHPDGITAKQWWTSVSRYADATLAKQLEFTDPARVPATDITGQAQGIAGGPSSATVAVPTDAGRVVLTCVLVQGKWLVSDLDLERRPG